MPPLLLVPCSSGKSLPIADGLRGRSLLGLPAERRASAWRSEIAEAEPRVTVSALYKGGAWTLAREAAAAASRRNGATYVVSAGLGLAAFDALVPGYDITFTAGSPDLIPGGTSPEARASWWRDLAGPEALEHAWRSGPHDVLLVALPEAYLDAVAPCLAEVTAMFGANRVSVFASRLNPFARRHLSECWVPATAEKTTTLRGNAAQSSLSALLHALENLPADSPVTRPAVMDLLERIARREVPLYPKRERRGRAHAFGWLGAAIASDRPPNSASEALRLYRHEGFAYEQKAFHHLFAEVTKTV